MERKISYFILLFYLFHFYSWPFSLEAANNALCQRRLVVRIRWLEGWVGVPDPGRAQVPWRQPERRTIRRPWGGHNRFSPPFEFKNASFDQQKNGEALVNNIDLGDNFRRLTLADHFCLLYNLNQQVIMSPLESEQVCCSYKQSCGSVIRIRISD